MKKILLVLLSMVMVFSLAGCSGGSDTIKIGVLSPTSGEGSVHGVPVEQAAKMAAEEINAAGGINGKDIEIIAYDTKADQTEAVNAYNRLRDQDEIVGLVGGTYSGTTLAFIDTAVSDNMPVVSPTATNPDVTLKGDNVFRACYTDAYQGKVCGTFAVNDLAAQTPAVLFNKDDAYSEGLANEFVMAAEEAGLTVIVETYAAGDVDFSAQLTNIKDAGADVLFIPHYTNTVGPILTQISAMEMDITCLGGDGWDGITDDYAAEAEGFYFANHYATDDEVAIVQDFINAYKEKYDETPNALGALGYDAVYVMAEAIEAAGSTDSADIIAAIAATDRDSVTGHIVFDADGNPQKSVAMIKVVNGENTLYAKVTP